MFIILCERFIIPIYAVLQMWHLLICIASLEAMPTHLESMFFFRSLSLFEIEKTWCFDVLAKKRKK